MTGLEKLDPKTLGQRLSDARKAKGVTQQEAAKHLGCSRPTVIAIEKGTRATSSEEIVQLCLLYGRKVSEIVRLGEPLADLQTHLRAVAHQMKADDAELLKAIGDLQRFAEDYNHLEKILKVPLRLNYPPEVQLGKHVDVSGLAEDEAIKERQRLGLGDQPAIHLRSLLEAEVGLRIIYDDLPSRMAGMFAYSGEFGGVIAVNRKHPAERRRATLLHEYGHLITDRYKPGIDYLSYPGRKPSNERFAEFFSMAFLMPATSVRRRFNQVVNDSGDFYIADLCRLSHFYFVSLEAMTLRLEGLGVIPKGVRDHLKESRFEVHRASEILNLRQHPVTDRRFPDRFVFLAAQAFDRGELSEGELASILRCDRVTARELVDQFLTTTDVSDAGEIRHMQIESNKSLLQVSKSTTGGGQRVITLDD